MRPSTVRSWWWGYLCGALSVIAAVGLINSPIAKADDSDARAYASEYGPAVCATLDDYPSIAGIIGIGQAIVEDGLTEYDAGTAIAYSVVFLCPRHVPLLQRFARIYGKAAV